MAVPLGHLFCGWRELAGQHGHRNFGWRGRFGAGTARGAGSHLAVDFEPELTVRWLVGVGLVVKVQVSAVTGISGGAVGLDWVPEDGLAPFFGYLQAVEAPFSQ